MSLILKNIIPVTFPSYMYVKMWNPDLLQLKFYKRRGFLGLH